MGGWGRFHFGNSNCFLCVLLPQWREASSSFFDIALVLQGLDSKLSEISTFGIASGCKKVLEALLESAKGPDVDPSELSRISTS